jgi:hypothetical protein
MKLVVQVSIIEPNDTPTDELEANKTKVTTSGLEQCGVVCIHHAYYHIIMVVCKQFNS